MTLRIAVRCARKRRHMNGRGHDGSGKQRFTFPALLLGLALLLASSLVMHAQIVLDGPNVSGTVGLSGETFGSGNVSLSWAGGSVNAQLVGGDADFSVRVQPDTVLNASVGMYSFQNATNAYVYQYVGNIAGPAASATTPMQLNLARNGGRVVGHVDVTGGTVTRVDISAYKSVTSSEIFSGNATAVTAPYDAILPFVAASGVPIQGSAILRASAGCDVPVTLAARSVDVPAGGSVTAVWAFDLTSEQCNQGSIQGQVSFTGLDGLNADAVVSSRYVQASGPVSRNQVTDSSGRYVFGQLPSGTYYVGNYDYFNSPYYYFWSNSAAVAVSAGQLATQDFAHTVSTAHGRLRPYGAWSLSESGGLYVYFSALNGSTWLGQGVDYADPSTGNIDLVLPAGAGQLDQWFTFFSSYNDVRSTWQYLSTWFSQGNSPLRFVTTAGQRYDLGVFQPETSASQVVVQLPTADVGLRTLRLSGYFSSLDNSGRYLGGSSIDLTSNAVSTPQNSVSVLVRGVPGTYRMTATGQGTDGATYSKQFDLVLGAPQNTSTGTNVTTSVTLVDQTTGASTTASVTFGNVTTTGETTVSASGTGPQAPGNFKVFGPRTMQYFDIQTTATFDSSVGATVCLSYDDTGLSLNQERQLSLQHYTCDSMNTSCSWTDITSTGYPDTTANKICGVTPGFSIFAILQPLDGDGDGILDGKDNCPAVQNAAQSDIDSDGLGDACDSDVDGDRIDDTADNCPVTPNALQADLDGDNIGDACDDDIDGDGIANLADNCRLNRNSSQVDFDGDGVGDACDPDDDGDGIADEIDSCAGTPAAVVIAPDGCSSPQELELVCPQNASYRNHGQYVQCVAHEAEQQSAIGLITADEKNAMVATAAKSNVGK